MQSWVALSDRRDPADPRATGALATGALVIEIAVPLKGAQVLLDYRQVDGGLRAFSVFHDAKEGLGILHRRGDRVVRHMLPGALPETVGTARIVLRWSVDGAWVLRYELPDAGRILKARGTGAMPLLLADIDAMCRGVGVNQRHPAVMWYGATQGVDLPERAPWLGLRTPIAVPGGFQMAGFLRAGDRVLTRDGSPRTLRAVRRMDLPGRGTFAPVLLRAPYFAAEIDLLVSSDMLVVLGGPEVEYLTSDEEALAEAGHLTDGTSAAFDRRRAAVTCVALDLGEQALVQSLGCIFALGGLRESSTLRILRQYEATPLLALLGRGHRSRAA